MVVIDEPGSKQGREVGCYEVILMRELEGRLKLFLAHFSVQRLKKLNDLPGNLPGRLHGDLSGDLGG